MGLKQGLNSLPVFPGALNFSPVRGTGAWGALPCGVRGSAPQGTPGLLQVLKYLLELHYGWLRLNLSPGLKYENAMDRANNDWLSYL